MPVRCPRCQLPALRTSPHARCPLLGPNIASTLACPVARPVPPRLCRARTRAIDPRLLSTHSQVFIDGELLGGYDDLASLHASGKLEQLR